MSIDRNECFNEETTVLVVEILKKDHHLAEVVELELENLDKYGTFEEVHDEGQMKIMSRWVITRKTK